MAEVYLFIFDFDGTLVDTAAIKRASFFAIFPDRHAGVVEQVLSEDPDGSRHRVIPEMAARCDDASLDPSALIVAYGQEVARQVPVAEAIEGAALALKWAAAQGKAYVFSVTPHEELVDALSHRGWINGLEGVFGFPNSKPETVRDLMKKHGVDADATFVIGDGTSDAEAARLNNCHWIEAVPGWPEKLRAVI